MIHSVHPSPFLQEGIKPPTKFSKGGGAWQDLNFQMGVGEKEGGDFFWVRGEGCCNFTLKYKLKSEILNGKKKVVKQKCFSLTELRIQTEKF